MSGRKYTEIELHAAIAQGLQTCEEVETAAREAAASLAELSVAAESTDAATLGLRELEVDLTQALATAREAAQHTRATLADSPTNMGRAQDEARRARQIRDEIDSIRHQVGRALGSMDVHARCRAFEAALDSGADRFRHWAPEAFQSLREKAAALSAHLQRETLARNDTSGMVADLDGLATAASGMEAAVRESERLERRRQTILAALEQSCQHLGYSVKKSLPADPRECVTLEANTHGYGTIVMRLELAGTLRTQSDDWLREESPAFADESAKAPCQTWIDNLTEMMAHFGQSLDFKLERTGDSARRGKTARGLPAAKSMERSQGATGT